MHSAAEKNDQNLCSGNVSSDEPRDMLQAKLWQNPCPFSFRLNYLALLYNSPLYAWVEEQYGLRRPEYAVLYSLAISNGGSAMDVSKTSGFPKNTLSRAIKRLRELGLIDQREVPGIGPRQILDLTPKGRVLFDETMPAFAEIEQRMLACLSTGERQILLEILSKIVLSEEDWSGTLPASREETGTETLDLVHE